jgi:hypothetical protein
VVQAKRGRRLKPTLRAKARATVERDFIHIGWAASPSLAGDKITCPTSELTGDKIACVTSELTGDKITCPTKFETAIVERAHRTLWRSFVRAH